MEEYSNQKEVDQFNTENYHSNKLISLAISHDGEESTTSYINMINEKFNHCFGTVFIIFEDDDHIDNLIDYQNISIIPFLKPTNNKFDWLMILEIGEIPSLQLIDNLKDIVAKAPSQTNVIFFPVVLCDYLNGDIIKILDPVSRIFRQIPKIIDNNDMEEIILEDFPIIKFNTEIKLTEKE